MTSSIDSNILISLWDDDSENMKARRALDKAAGLGRLVVSGPVYAELMGGGGRTAKWLDSFFLETQMEVDWRMDQIIWQRAGLAYQGYVARRKKNKAGVAARMLTDFLIGAHAVRHGHTLITLDRRGFRVAFPELQIVSE